MPNLFGSYFRKTILFIFLIEILSFFGYLFLDFNVAAFFILTGLIFVISLKRLDWGFYAMIAELAIASKGHLFFVPIGSIDISFRLGIFIAVLTAAVIHVVRTRKFYFRSATIFLPSLVLVIIVGAGIINGWISNNELKTIFLDMNGYLYLGIAIVAFRVIRTKKEVVRVLQVLLAAITTTIFKSIFLLFFFSHNIFYVLPYIYRWVRVTGVGEITAMGSGFYRIFFQSHIYEIFGFFILASLLFLLKKEQWKKIYQRAAWVILTLSSMIVMASYSRSFWLGFFVGMLFLAGVLMVQLRFSLSRTVKFGGMVGLILILNAILIIGVIKFPWPSSSTVIFSDLISERTEDVTEEIGGASRLALLGPLTKKALENPVVGSGFGTTVTYQTKDPRALERNPSGAYTTYAFEWGYLDLIVKIGLVGIGVFLWLLFTIGRQAFLMIAKAKPSSFEQAIGVGLLTSLFILMVIHATTPYINHPLGIGFFISVAAILDALVKPLKTAS